MIPRLLSSPVTWACVALAAIVAVLIGLLLAGNAPDDVEFIPATFTTYATVPALLPAVLGGRPALRNTQGVYLPAEPPPVMTRAGS